MEKIRVFGLYIQVIKDRYNGFIDIYGYYFCRFSENIIFKDV